MDGMSAARIIFIIKGTYHMYVQYTHHMYVQYIHMYVVFALWVSGHVYFTRASHPMSDCVFELDQKYFPKGSGLVANLY